MLDQIDFRVGADERLGILGCNGAGKSTLIRPISRLYHGPFREPFDDVADFSEIGRQWHMPMRFYSSRMRLAFALSLAIDFECLLIDEVIMVGDARFQQKCHREIFELRQDRALIMAVHSTEIVKRYCTSALVLVGGRGGVFDGVNLAAEIYATL